MRLYYKYSLCLLLPLALTFYKHDFISFLSPIYSHLNILLNFNSTVLQIIQA